MDCFSVLGFGKSVAEVADHDLVVAVDLLAHLLSNVLSNNDLVVICLRNNNKRESLSVVVILRN